MTQHTPGPKTEPFPLDAMYGDIAAERDRLREINADLLEALTDITNFVEAARDSDLGNPWQAHANVGDFIQGARAAIARAKGEDR